MTNTGSGVKMHPKTLEQIVSSPSFHFLESDIVTIDPVVKTTTEMYGWKALSTLALFEKQFQQKDEVISSLVYEMYLTLRY